MSSELTSKCVTARIWPRTCPIRTPDLSICSRKLLGQHAMDKRNCDRAFTDGRCHALDVAAPNVAHGEHARTRGFEQIGRALEWPLGNRQIMLRQVWPGLDEALLVERDTAIQPTRIRFGPSHQEHVPDVVTR